MTPAQRILGEHYDFRALRKDSEVDAEELKKDRRALGGLALKGAALVTAGGLMLRKNLKGGKAKQGRILASKLAKQQAKKAPRPISKTARKQQAWQNAQRKGDAVKRSADAAALRSHRGYDAVEKPLGKRVGQVKPKVRDKAARLLKESKTASVPNKSGAVTQKEQFKMDREARRRKRGELGALRKKHRFEVKERDNLSKARDVAIVAGAGGVAVGGVTAGVAANKAGKEVKKAADFVRVRGGQLSRQVSARVTPEKITKAAGKQVKKAAKKKVKELFPTFVKGAKAASRVAKMKVFETPAERILEFNKREQMRNVNTDVFAGPIKAYAGIEKAYVNTAKGPRSVVAGQLNPQVVRSAWRTAGTANKVAKRAGGLLSDAGDVVAGRPRKRDAAGRKKKREWEKAWFKDGQRKAAVGGAIVGGAALLAKKPRLRKKVVKAIGKGMDKANEVAPDFFPRRSFETPADRILEFSAGKIARGVSKVAKKAVDQWADDAPWQVVNSKTGKRVWSGTYAKRKIARRVVDRRDIKYGAAVHTFAPVKELSTPADQILGLSTPEDHLTHFDRIAAEAGWDVRDPRGKSARVFAPGSRKRVRRQKKWHEEIDNERKLRNIGTGAALVAGLGLGVAGTRAVMKRGAAKAAKQTIASKGGYRVPKRKTTRRPHPLRRGMTRQGRAEKVVPFRTGT